MNSVVAGPSLRRSVVPHRTSILPKDLVRLQVPIKARIVHRNVPRHPTINIPIGFSSELVHRFDNVLEEEVEEYDVDHCGVCGAWYDIRVSYVAWSVENWDGAMGSVVAWSTRALLPVDDDLVPNSSIKKTEELTSFVTYPRVNGFP